ncbi:hypothetical protein AA13595_1716 [Gluconacetobacter johannae DSM 13595]|nr:hypothetical protein AA13595_1716 [Gluconacetobacter johannae DSM 13595]
MEGTKKLPPADIIIHNHVLEHIPADFAETIQALNSLLVPGGIQAFTIPIRPGKFDEDLSPSLSDDERRQRFYQEDHVRIFGTDDAVPMMQSIMKTDKVVFRLNEHISPELAAAYGLTTTYKADRIDSVCSNTVFYYIKPL